MFEQQNISNDHENTENFLYSIDKYTLSHQRSCLSRRLVRKYGIWDFVGIKYDRKCPKFDRHHNGGYVLNNKNSFDIHIWILNRIWGDRSAF